MSDTVQPARLTIVHYVASCKGCPFNTRSLREAHSHCLSENHPLSVAKYYRMEPPE